MVMMFQVCKENFQILVLIQEELMASLEKTLTVLLKSYKKTQVFQLMEFVVLKFSKQLKD